MTSAAVAFSHEAYGTYARVSAAADWIELHVFSGHTRIKFADIADWIEDSDFYQQFGVNFGHVGKPRSVPDASEATGLLTDIIAQRADILGSSYPFSITSNGISPSAHSPRHHGYLYLLGLSTAHAYKLAVAAALPDVFERSLARVMGRLGSSTTLRQHWVQGHGFAGALRSAAMGVALRPATVGSPTTVSVSAVDEGLDVITHADWLDQRTGRWVFIGQATVAKSDRWEQKAGEVRPTQWKELVQERIMPQAFLAVPYHIEDAHWDHLLYSDRVLVDRLRMAPWIRALSDEERPFVELLRSLRLESLRP